MNESKPAYAIWFARFRQYDTEKLGAAGIIFFNFLIYRAKGKNYGEFPITDSFILKECGIKRTQLESLTKRFVGMGFLSARTKGIQNPTNYFVDFKKLASLDIAKNLIKPDSVDELLPFFKQEAKNQAAAQSSMKTTKASEKSMGVSKWELESLIQQLNDTYAHRVKIHNDNIAKNPHLETRKKIFTAFHPSRAEKFNLTKLFVAIEKDGNALSSALMVFFDEVLSENRQIRTSILSYFLTHGEENDFPVFRECLDKFKLSYGHK